MVGMLLVIIFFIPNGIIGQIISSAGHRGSGRKPKAVKKSAELAGTKEA